MKNRFIFYILSSLVILSACNTKIVPEEPTPEEDPIVYPLSQKDAVRLVQDKVDKYWWSAISKDLLTKDFILQSAGDHQLIDYPGYDYWLIVFNRDPSSLQGDYLYLLINPLDGTYKEYLTQGIPHYRSPTDPHEYFMVPIKVNGVMKMVPRKQTARTKTQMTSQSPHKWALIISGGEDMDNNSVLFWNDCSQIYTTLIDNYGYDKNHVFVLMSDGLSSSPDYYDGTSVTYKDSEKDLDGDGEDDIDMDATLSSVATTLQNLSSSLTEEDQLFIFITDHGRLGNNGEPHAVLWGSNSILTASQLASELDDFDDGVRILLQINCCYSGGFLDYIDRENIAIATACEAGQLAHAYFDDQTYTYTMSCFGHFINESYNDLSADLNFDGEVSFLEAFNHAVSTMAEDNNNNEDMPQYLSNPSSLGRRYGLSGKYLCKPSISGSQYISTATPGTYSISDFPINSSVSWSSNANLSFVPQTDSTVSVRNTSGLVFDTGVWIRATFDQEYEAVTRQGIEIWHTGTIRNDNMISGGIDGGFASFSLPYNIAHNNSYEWGWSLGSNAEYQGYYLTDFDGIVEEEVSFPYTVWVSMTNPLGETTTVTSNKYE